MQVRPRLGKHRSATSLYIAMAHAGLATALLVLYVLYLLLADFLHPLQ
jgi:succinate dehydrogenase hydrophobic anchor subunit